MVLVEAGRKVEVGPEGLEPIAATDEGRRDLQVVAGRIPGLVGAKTLAAVEAIESRPASQIGMPIPEQHALGGLLVSHS